MLDEVIQLDKKYYLNTFGDRLPVCFEKGEGMKLFDDKGNTYYDFLGVGARTQRFYKRT